jgi:hypothetical protein
MRTTCEPARSAEITGAALTQDHTAMSRATRPFRHQLTTREKAEGRNPKELAGNAGEFSPVV